MSPLPKLTARVSALAFAAVVLVLALPATSRAQTKAAAAMDDSWHFAVAPYFWAAGIDGTVSVKGVVEVHKGEGSDRKKFDLTLKGPYVWVAYSW